MKVVELAKTAASSEGLLLQKTALRFARRAAFLVVAAVFGFFALISVHVVLWTLCEGPWHTGKVWASVIVLGVDVLFLVVFLLLGRGKLPDPVEVEARIVRDRALHDLRNAVALTAVTSTIMGPAGRYAGRGAFAAVRSLLRRRKPSRPLR
ncbi:hypothetical protein [Lichenicoccus roseus]|uniref:Phage holin family protein n=1 Tax=Lichenicoccus roseus TaxID=2683649 RepID=A0A5R9J1V4_9PROT|nr:hypothetical protein [Lichenicoccus roseus]TLU71620.1 hypothetical protein FE263_14160 [Lichenicoccus roseus]